MHDVSLGRSRHSEDRSPRRQRRQHAHERGRVYEGQPPHDPTVKSTAQVAAVPRMTTGMVLATGRHDRPRHAFDTAERRLRRRRRIPRMNLVRPALTLPSARATRRGPESRPATGLIRKGTTFWENPPSFRSTPPPFATSAFEHSCAPPCGFTPIPAYRGPLPVRRGLVTGALGDVASNAGAGRNHGEDRHQGSQQSHHRCEG